MEVRFDREIKSYEINKVPFQKNGIFLFTFNNNFISLNPMREIVFFFSFVLLCVFLEAQNKTIDSLKLELVRAKHDTTKCQILHMLAEAASDEEWQIFSEKLFKLADSKLKLTSLSKREYQFYQKKAAHAFCLKAYAAHAEGNISKALGYYEAGLKLFEESGDKSNLAFTLHQMAYILQNQGDIRKALEYNFKSLAIKEKMADKTGISLSLNAIATNYYTQGEYSKALEFYFSSLKIQEEIGDKEGIAQSLNNIGVIYKVEGDPKVKSSKKESLNEGKLKALEYYNRCFKIYEEIGDKRGMSTSLNNIGTIYADRGDMTKALEYYSQSLSIRQSINDKYGVANSFISFGSAYLTQKNYPEALKFALQSMKISNELQYVGCIRDAAELLDKTYKATGNYKLAYENYQLYIQMRDSMKNEAIRKTSIQQQLKYEYEKQALADSVAHAKESEIKNAKLAQQEAEISEKQNQQYALYGGLFLVLVFAGFMYNRFRVTQKQKIIIEQKEKETQKQNEIISYQKQQVEEKQKEILDSIHYAQRIQKALFPSEKNIERVLGRLKNKR